MPFGGGPRACIGQLFALLEAKVIVIGLLQHVHLTLVPGQRICPKLTITIQPRYGLLMTCQCRALTAHVAAAAEAVCVQGARAPADVNA